MRGSRGGQIIEKLYFDKSADKVSNSQVNVQNRLLLYVHTQVLKSKNAT